MRDSDTGRSAGLCQSFARLLQELFMSKAGNESAFLFEDAARGNRFHHCVPQFSDSRTRERGNQQSIRDSHLLGQIRLVRGDQCPALRIS